jgi:hypothetical protein
LRRAVLWAAALVAASAPARAEPDDEGWGEARRQVSLPLVYNARPITLPEDVFDVFMDGGFTQLSPEFLALSLAAGTRYGVSDDLEAGVRLIRVTVSDAPDTGLGRPTAYGQYRLVAGAVEASARLELELPTSAGPIASWLSFPALARLGPFLRVDLAPTLVTTTGGVWQYAATLPAELSGQLTDRLRLFAAAEVGVPNLRAPDDLLLVVGGGAAWTFGGRHPSAELRARVTGPAVALAGDRPQDPAYGNYWSGGVSLRLYFAGPDEDWQRSPF